MKLIQRAAVILAILLSLSVRPGRAEPRMPVITIHAKRFAFRPSEITLKAGQTVKLVFIADDVSHGLVVDGLGIDMQILKNHYNKVILTPSKAGDFNGECIRYCGVGHSGMTFSIHVVN